MSKFVGLESASVNVMGVGDINPATITFISVPDYEYTFDGSVSLSGSSQVVVGISSGFESSWDVEGVFSSGFLSEWGVGDGEYYWYRVEGSCGEVRCDTAGIQYPDCQNMTFMTVVAARNMPELCERLLNPMINPRVNFRLGTIKRYSRPAFVSAGSDECNSLEEQEFCQVAECLEFCIDQDVVQSFSMSGRVVESVFFVEMGGGVSVSGQVETDRNRFYVPAFPTVVVFGAATFKLGAFHESSGSVVLSGSSAFVSNRYSFASDSEGPGLGGFARTVSPSRGYLEAGGSVALGGSARFAYGPSLGGSLEVSGASDFSTLADFVSSGNIELGGRLLDYVSPTYFGRGRGGSELSGSASYNFTDLGPILSPFVFDMSAFGLASESSEVGGDSDLTISDLNINPSCGCGPMSMSLSLDHNLANSAFLSSFLRRAGLSMENRVRMRYRSDDSSWRSNVILLGRGRDGVSSEEMVLAYLLSCTDGFWNFSFSATLFNKTTGSRLGTKFILDMPSDLICSDGSISTSIELNIMSGEFNVAAGESYFVTSPIPTTSTTGSRPLLTNPLRRGVDVFLDGKFSDKRIYYDNIGLFKDPYWTGRPLKMKINSLSGSEMESLELSRMLS